MSSDLERRPRGDVEGMDYMHEHDVRACLRDEESRKPDRDRELRKRSWLAGTATHMLQRVMYRQRGDPTDFATLLSGTWQEGGSRSPSCAHWA